MRKDLIANKIWACTTSMRGGIDPSEYKTYLFGLIFYKYLSENEVGYLLKSGWEPDELKLLSCDNEEELDEVKDILGYAIPYDNLFSMWLEKGPAFSVKDITDGIEMFNKHISDRYQDLFMNIFDGVISGLAQQKKENTAELTAMFKKMLDAVHGIPTLSEDNGDALGFIYEFLMGKFAAGAGASAGEYYTPSHVSKLISRITAYEVRDKEHIDIYDPACGSGSLLLNIGNEFARYRRGNDKEGRGYTGKVKYYAQDKMKNTYDLCKMNLLMREVGLDNIECRNADTLKRDWPWEDGDEKKALCVDVVAANPPYSLVWDTEAAENDPRFAFGCPPKKKAEYAFLLSGLYHLKSDGVMAIVLPHGTLFRGGSEAQIRKNLIDSNMVTTVISLPPNMFYGTGIPTVILILKKDREDGTVLFIDASKEFIKIKKKNEMTEGQIKKIFDTYIARKDVTNYARVVSKDEIIANDYNLNIPRYVSADGDTNIPSDLLGLLMGHVSEKQLSVSEDYWRAYPTLKDELYTANGIEGYYNIVNGDFRKIIEANADIKKYKARMGDLLEESRTEMIELLLDYCESQRFGDILSDLMDLMYNNKLEAFSLLDKYTIYDLLFNSFSTIRADIETIRDKGSILEACHMLHEVVKENGEKPVKYAGKDIVNGEIIPVSMLWERYLAKEKTELEDFIAEKEQARKEYVEMFEDIPEELDREFEKHSLFNTDKKSFSKNMVKNVKKKDILTDEALEFISKAQGLQEKIVSKKVVNSKIEAFLKKSTDLLTDLSLDDCKELLADKWVNHLIAEVYKLAEMPITNLVSKLSTLNRDYEEGIFDIETALSGQYGSLYQLSNQLTYKGDKSARVLQSLREYFFGVSNGTGTETSLDE